VRHSGLFWIAQVPDSALVVEGDTVRLRVREIPVVDSTFFLGPGNTFATASFDLTWTASGPVEHFRPLSSDPKDPTNFAGEFRSAVVAGSFTVFEGDVTIGCLQMIRQTVVRAVEIVAFVFNAEAKIPFSGNQKAMVIAEIVVERIAVAELRLLEIAAERIRRFVRENVV